VTKGLKTDWDGHDSRQWEQIRAFEHGQQMGIEREQERIIKLLEIEAVRHEQLLLNASADYLLGIIDFIKGENN
jgi:hypothetical protein